MKAGDNRQHSLFLPWDVNGVGGDVLFLEFIFLGCPYQRMKTYDSFLTRGKKTKAQSMPRSPPGDCFDFQWRLQSCCSQHSVSTGDGQAWAWCSQQQCRRLGLCPKQLPARWQKRTHPLPWFSIPADFFKNADPLVPTPEVLIPFFRGSSWA